MSRETELLSFLEDVLKLRVQNLSNSAMQEEDFIKMRQKSLSFFEGVTEDSIKVALMDYEDIKNKYCTLLAYYMYRQGLKDSVLMFKVMIELIIKDV